jgi:Ferredoxin-like domain in Api92-like protein
LANCILNDLFLKGDPVRIEEFLRRHIPLPQAIKIGRVPGGANWFDIDYVNLNTRTIDLGFFRIMFETGWVPALPVLDRLKESFPDLTFEFDWTDLDANPYEGFVEKSNPEKHPHSWNYPKVDPYQFEQPQWLHSSLRLLAILAPPLVATAEATQKPFTWYGRDIADAMLVLIPRLITAALAAGDIPQRQLVESLLRSCGYDDFANCVATHKENTPGEGDAIMD